MVSSNSFDLWVVASAINYAQPWAECIKAVRISSRKLGEMMVGHAVAAFTRIDESRNSYDPDFVTH
jgi:hypothetical protein